MIVNQIEWLSREAQEALLFISDGQHECAAFSHPCTFDKDYVLLEPILAFSTKEIMLSQEAKVLIKRRGESLVHDVVGILSGLDPMIISIGNIRIELEDELPSGIKQNDIVQFSCGRLDVIR